jgi:hypothetical protein
MAPYRLVAHPAHLGQWSGLQAVLPCLEELRLIYLLPDTSDAQNFDEFKGSKTDQGPC